MKFEIRVTVRNGFGQNLPSCHPLNNDSSLLPLVRIICRCESCTCEREMCRHNAQRSQDNMDNIDCSLSNVEIPVKNIKYIISKSSCLSCRLRRENTLFQNHVAKI